MSLAPKNQWRIKSAWEEHWENVARLDEDGKVRVDTSYLPTSPLFGYGYASEAFLAGLNEQRRILFLGNGISREPLDYYFSGFDVTVLDISEKACELFTHIKTNVFRNVQSFLHNTSFIPQDNQDQDIKDIAKPSKFIYRPGGTIKVVNADMFNWQPHVKWHYIHNKLAFINFTEQDQEFLLSLYESWLEKSGHLQISYYWNPPNPFGRIANMAKKVGFLVRDEDINEVFKKARSLRDNPEKEAEVWSDYKRRECEKDTLVAHGAKMLWVIWGSVL